MGNNGETFINHIKKSYSNEGTAGNNVSWFKYLYSYLEDKGFNPENITYEEIDTIEEQIDIDDRFNPNYRTDCRRLLRKYVKLLNGEEKRSGKVRILESTPTVATFDRIKNIDIVEVVGDNQLEVTSPFIRVRYDSRVSADEKIPGLITYIIDEFEKIMDFGWSKEFFRRNSSLYDCINIVLSPLHIRKTYSKPYDPKELDAILDKYEEMGIKVVPTDEVRKAMKGVSISNKIDGKYVYGNDIPTIYIYYRVLDNSSNEAYLADVRRILAHELFHAVHHIEANAKFEEHSDEAIRVKEALADFFSFTYCLYDICRWPRVHQKSIECARKRYIAWRRAMNSIWPYAYALYFTCINGEWVPYTTNFYEYRKARCIGKFREVFGTSRLSMEQAYSILVEKTVQHVSAAPSPLRSATNTTLNPNVLHMITMPSVAKFTMDPEELEEAFYVDNVNSKDSLAPVFIMEILMQGNGKKYGPVEIQKMLEDVPYRINTRINAIRRHLNTLAVNYDYIWRVEEGHKLLYLYSETKPKNCITWDDVE